MTWFDWVLAGIIVLSILAAAAEGFFFELFSLGGAVLGFVLASWESWRFAPWFEPHVKSAAIANAVAFGMVFFATVILAGVAGKVTRWVMDKAGMRWVDRLLGAAFGLVRGVVVGTAVVWAATTFTPQAPWLERSELSRYFLLTARIASWTVPAGLRQQFQEGVAQVRKARMQDAAEHR